MAGKIYSEKREIRKARLTRNAENSILEFRADLIKATQRQASKMSALIIEKNRAAKNKQPLSLETQRSIAELSVTNKCISLMNQAFFKYADYIIDRIRHNECNESELESIIQDPWSCLDVKVSTVPQEKRLTMKRFWSQLRSADLIP